MLLIYFHARFRSLKYPSRHDKSMLTINSIIFGAIILSDELETYCDLYGFILSGLSEDGG
jgi:hypothetical protein